MSASGGDGRLWGVLVQFDNVHDFMPAVSKVRDAGYRHWDVHTPFPVHGMDDAMGIRGTRLPWLILGGGLTGLAAATLMIWWMNAVDYPFVISGKPLFGLPAAVPIMFELTVLFSAFATFLGMWGLNGMPRLHHPLLAHPSFRRATQDRFFIVVEARDPAFDPRGTRDFLGSLGGGAVEDVHDSAED